MQCFILKGRDKATGQTVYWTGRAGDLYSSPKIAEAFPCGREFAERRLRSMNNNLAPIKWTAVVEVCK